MTVKVHRGQVMRKMQAGSLPEVVRMADRLARASSDVAGILYESASASRLASPEPAPVADEHPRANEFSRYGGTQFALENL
jgi:hypothetical protein